MPHLLGPLERGPDWPQEAEDKYERLEILGKGSFGMVWMARRTSDAIDNFDDEFVAVKNINIKDDKGKVYAEREISILQELRHPHVIRLIRPYDIFGGTRLVVMQLARGPNLHQLVVKRGALGMPLSRLVSRQLVAAVSYLHGRAVIHRDIKPSNCILACTSLSPTEDYDWYADDAIWNNHKDGEDAVKENKWKLMLVDFGFARALEKDEIVGQSRPLRNSIVFEKKAPLPVTEEDKAEDEAEEQDQPNGAEDKIEKKPSEEKDEEKVDKKPTEEKDEEELQKKPSEDKDFDHGDGSDDLEMLDKLVEQAASKMKVTSFQANNGLEDAIMGGGDRRRKSGISMPLPTSRSSRRVSSARQHVRSMSALGTKAYAAPEIRRKLRHKTEADFEKANAAMTECVADYGMIVDSYSVGWTLRVAMTGVPPNFTISEYMHERDTVILADEEDILMQPCCCFKSTITPGVRIRDPSMMPYEATLLISHMTEKNPEDRITVREAQNHPWIAGGHDEEKFDLPPGDVPSKHGDPVVPLDCAPALSKLTVQYHMQ